MLKAFTLNKYIKTIEEYLFDILNATECHIALTYIIDYNTNNIILNNKCKNDAFLNISFEEFILSTDYNKFDSIIKLLSDRKNILVIDNNKSSNDNYSCISSFLKNEVYLPIFEDYDKNDNVIGFVYLGSVNENKNILNGSVFIKDILKIVKRINTKLSKIYIDQKAKQGLINIIHKLNEFTISKEPYMANHSYTVAYWCTKIALKLNLSDNEIQKLQYAAMLHDIGRAYIDSDILNKSTPLTPNEYEIIKKRVIYSFSLAENISNLYNLDNIPEIIKYHQERIDGKGYPYGILGEQIPFLSKILNIADAISAMLSNENFRKAKTIDEIIKQLHINKGLQFDADITNIAISIMLEFKNQNTDIFSGMGTFAVLTLNTTDSDEPINLQGNIKNTDNEKYIFTPSFINTNFVNNSTIVKFAFIYIQNDGYVLEYKALIEKIEADKIVISKLKNDIEADSFSIKWNFNAILVSPKKDIYSITIVLLGANFLQFNILESNMKNFKNDLTIVVIKLNFDDDNSIILPGKITESYKLNNKIYFKFTYTGIDMSTKDKLFKYMFKKQIKLKNLYNMTNK